MKQLRQQTFDEQAQTALRILLERFWVLRLKEPETYQLIREREKVLKRYFVEKFGFDLIVHQHFIKLEKIPVESKSWMGIQDFQETRDYVIFCCALAFTESKEVEEQFLLSNICEEIKDLYPGDIPLDWTNYHHRRSLVRVIKFMEKLSIIETVEGETDQFALDEDEEVLYETTIYARYFMRTYPKDIFEYDSIEDILNSEWERHEADERRKRVYRKLIISPVVYRENEDDPDFSYIRNYRNRLREDLAEHTSFRLELFKNNAQLVSEERKQDLTLFPNQKSIMDIAIHFASYIREHIEEFQPDEFDQIRMTSVKLEQTVKTVKDIYGNGWSKQYRESTVRTVAQELVDLLIDWEMMTIDDETDTYVILPLLGRLSGNYPKDFRTEEKKRYEKQ